MFQKAGDACVRGGDWASGGDGKGNVFEKTGRAAGDLWSSCSAEPSAPVIGTRRPPPLVAVGKGG